MTEQPIDDSFNNASARFLTWLRINGTSISHKLELADLRSRSAGRGAIAREDIEEDEELFSIPRSSILTIETSSVPVELQKTLDDPWLSLVLALVYEFQQGTESKWKPYLGLVPSEFDTLMYWSKEELQELEGSAVVNKIGKASADNLFLQQLIPLIRQNESKFRAQELSDSDILAVCHRMASTIMAYAFDLENSSGEADANADGWEEDSDEGAALSKGMIPLADMLNADADLNNAKLFYEDDKVTMKALRPISKGEELFNDYGPLPTADILRRYGYITENYSRYDVVEISLELVKEAAADRNKDSVEALDDKIRYLEEQGAIDDSYDISRSFAQQGSFSDELKILLNILTMPRDAFEKLRSKEKLPKPELSEEAATLLYDVLARRAALYLPSNDHGQPPGSNVEATSHTARRRMMAHAVIEGEKRVLQEAAETVHGMLGSGQKRKAATFENDILALQQRSKKADIEIS